MVAKGWGEESKLEEGKRSRPFMEEEGKIMERCEKKWGVDEGD